jgi:hypothetical protein
MSSCEDTKFDFEVNFWALNPTLHDKTVRQKLDQRSRHLDLAYKSNDFLDNRHLAFRFGDN